MIQFYPKSLSSLTICADYSKWTCHQRMEMECSCSLVDSRVPTILEHLCLLRMKDAQRHCASQARQRRFTDATLHYAAQTVSRRFVNTAPRGRRPWPRAGFESRKSNCFRLLAFPLSYPPPPTHTHTHTHTLLPTLSSFQEWSVKKLGILQHSLRLRRREEGKKLYHPVRLIEDISEALGVRHSSSSFLHWRLYKQVSNAPDLVWQTFSKEHLKKGWENDTHTCFCFFSGACRIRAPFILLFNRCSISLCLSFTRLLLLFPFYSDRSPVDPSNSYEMAVI